MKNLFLAIACFSTIFSTLAVTTTENIEMTRDIQIDSLELASFMDGIMEALLEERKIAGASLLILKDNEILVKKGYGYADIDNKIKVDPDSTLFRIGSISKLFTWISVMQLVEQGKLDLDTDINEYLEEFKVPETFDDPITLRSIMSHTPGFEDKLYRLFVKSEEEIEPLADIFKNQMPKRVRPPLEYAAYSNHGTGLAQHLIEITSGMSFEDYTEQNIFNPLDLNQTTFRQPIPESIEGVMSKGYTFESGTYNEKYFEFVPMAGAGAASTTASDMEIFMSALLENSCIDNVCLLNDSIYKLMQTDVLTHAKGLNSSLLGFMDISINGIKIIGHGGDTFWFHSLLALIPESNLGFFVSFNSASGGGAYEKVFEKFLERYFPDNRTDFETLEFDNEYLENFAGKYKVNRHTHTDLFKILAITNPITISVSDKKLRLDGYNKEASFWSPIDSTRFKSTENNELIAFEFDNSKTGKLFIGNMPIMAFERIEGKYSNALHLTIFVITWITILFILIGWPLIALIRKKHQRLLPAPQLIPFPAKLVGWIVAACFFVFYLIVFIASANSGVELIMGIPTSIKLALFLPFMAMPFLLLMLLQSIILWNMKDVKWRSRLFYYFSIVVFVAAIWQLSFWNLLGWHY